MIQKGLSSLGKWFREHKHIALALYVPVFFIWFGLLERYMTPVIWTDTPLDALIPFNELFVIPYYLWYIYVPAAAIYFFFRSKPDYYRLCTFLFSGMTICLILYMIIPNGQMLRPVSFPRDNFLTDVVKSLYRTDTPTNVCPSMHCLNAIGVHIAVRRSKELSKLRVPSGILMVLVCLSTMFLKQHPVLDVVAAILMAVPLYWAVYRVDWSSIAQRFRARRSVSGAVTVRAENGNARMADERKKESA
ncbi:MAG: serine/threonine protein phosphatase [Oscillospiraceae bacterium]